MKGNKIQIQRLKDLVSISKGSLPIEKVLKLFGFETELKLADLIIESKIQSLTVDWDTNQVFFDKSSVLEEIDKLALVFEEYENQGKAFKVDPPTQSSKDQILPLITSQNFEDIKTENRFSLIKEESKKTNESSITDVMKQHDENLIAKLKASLEPYKNQINQFSYEHANAIELKGQIFSEVMIEKCLKIQLLAKNRWLSYRYIYRALGISRNVKSLRSTVNALKTNGFLQTRKNFPLTSPKQELRLVKPFIEVEFEE